MLQKVIIPVVVAAMLVVGWRAVSTSSDRADFTYVNPSGIHTLDPARMSWTQDFRVALNLWEGLTTWDPQKLEPLAGAAEIPPNESEDRLVHTFTIRSNARWSNGDPVTAEDFVRGWRRAMEPGTSADYAFFFTDFIEGATEYVAWRHDAVDVLAALASLEDHKRIGAEEARLVARFAESRKPESQEETWPLLPDQHAATARWEEYARQLGDAEIDWARVSESVFDRHAAELEAQFSRVGAKAIDDLTFEIRLVRPCPYLLDITGFPTLLPIHSSIEVLRERHRETPLTKQGLVVHDPQWTKPNYHRNGYPGLVTNGAYRLSEWTFKRRARLVMNPFFHSAEDVACRTVDMLEYENISASLMAFEAGDVDFLTDLSVPYEHELYRLSHSGQRPEFRRCVVLATGFFNFNCTSATVGGRPNPFVDAQVRKAFTLAVDRRALVEKVRRRGDRVAQSFVPPDSIAGYSPPDGLDFDVAAARRLLEEAGYDSRTALGTIEILYPPSQEKMSQAVGRMWRDALGVQVELRAQESKTFAEERAKRRYMVAWGNWYADYNDPTTFLNCLTTGNGNNDTGYSNGEYDELLRRADDQRVASSRFDDLRQAERIIVEEDCPILPILHYAELIAVRPEVSGLFPNARLYFPFRWVSVRR